MDEIRIAELKSRFGTHEKVAVALGISPRQYENWRKGLIGEKAKRYLDLFCQSLESPDSAVVTESHEPCQQSQTS